MTLGLDTRHVGEVAIVSASGRIVDGAECDTLQNHLVELLSLGSCVLLDLARVDFIDSRGLGLLVRFLTRAQAQHGDLKLCAVPERISEVLRVSRVATLFDVHRTSADAIHAFYRGTRPTGAPERLRTDILCVDTSSDVLALLRALLKQTGYGVMSTDNISDAWILLKATRPKVVLISEGLRRGTTPTIDTFNRSLDSSMVVELPTSFATDDAGHATKDVLERIELIIRAQGRSVVGEQ